MIRLILSLCLMLTALPALAERRVALVIGNSAYVNTPALANPQNDARAIAGKLTGIGFEVFLHENLTGQQFRVALGQFAETALAADLAVVFYAGHGIEMGGKNFLIPVDAEMRSEATAAFETVSLDMVLGTVRQAGKLGMVMLDACRDNPFLAAMDRTNGTRSLARGLAPVTLEGESGVLVSFAAQAGQTADDGAGMHSPYTSALLEVLDEPGLEVGRMFRKVRARVKEGTAGRQVPIERMQLPDQDIYLVAALPGGGAPAPTPAPAPAVVPSPVEDPLLVFIDALQSGQKAPLEDFVRRWPDHPKSADARDILLDMADREFWALTQDKDTIDAYRTYLLAFSDGRFVAKATERLATLQPKPVVVPTPAPIPAPDTSSEFTQTSRPVTVQPSSIRTWCPAQDGAWSVTNIRTDDTLFVRSGPGTSNGKIGELPYNAAGIDNVSCRSDGWCSLQYGCISGWAYGAKYMANRRVNHAPSPYAGPYSVTHHPLDQKLNVRSGPGTEYGIVAELPPTATNVAVEDCQAVDNWRYRWCALSWGDVSGWAYAKYLTDWRGSRPVR